MAFENSFRSVIERNIVGGLPISLLLKANDSYCHLLSRQERENGEPGEAPRKFLRPSLFHVRETPSLKIEGTLKQYTFVLLLKRVGV